MCSCKPSFRLVWTAPSRGQFPFLSTTCHTIQPSWRRWRVQINLATYTVWDITWQRGCAWAVTVGGQFGGSPQTKRRRKAALGRHDLARVSADFVGAGCVACDDGGGGGVRKWAAHCGVAGWTLSAVRCRWSTGSPVRSSYHSPGPLNRHRPLQETEREWKMSENTQMNSKSLQPQSSQNPKSERTQQKCAFCQSVALVSNSWGPPKKNWMHWYCWDFPFSISVSLTFHCG